MTLPFGKYKGKALRDVPDEYLAWLAGCDWLLDPLKSAVEQESQRRAGQETVQDVAAAIVRAGTAALLRQYQDAGSSPEALARLREAQALLESWLAIPDPGEPTRRRRQERQRKEE